MWQKTLIFISLLLSLVAFGQQISFAGHESVSKVQSKLNYARAASTVPYIKTYFDLDGKVTGVESKKNENGKTVYLATFPNFVEESEVRGGIVYFTRRYTQGMKQTISGIRQDGYYHYTTKNGKSGILAPHTFNLSKKVKDHKFEIQNPDRSITKGEESGGVFKSTRTYLDGTVEEIRGKDGYIIIEFVSSQKLGDSKDSKDSKEQEEITVRREGDFESIIQQINTNQVHASLQMVSPCSGKAVPALSESK